MSRPLSIEDRWQISKVAATPLHFIEHRIRELEKVDLRDVRVDELIELLRPLLEIYVNQPLEFEKARSVFRARKNDEHLFNEVERLSAPPPKDAHLNRASIDGQPIFYCSTELDNAVFEVRPRIGEVVTVLRADLKGNESPRLIALGIGELAERHGVAIGGEPADLREEFFRRESESRRKMQLLDEFVISQFRRVVPEGKENRYLYKITAAIAQWCYRFSCEDGPVDGIIYPSIQSGGRGACLALLPGSVDRLFRASACCVMEIISASSNGRFQTRHGEARSISADGRIRWNLKTS